MLIKDFYKGWNKILLNLKFFFLSWKLNSSLVIIDDNEGEEEEDEDDDDDDDSDDNVHVTIGDIKTAPQYSNLNIKRQPSLAQHGDKLNKVMLIISK